MSVRLFIAEKPNVAKAIASVLNGGSLPSKNAQGTYQVGDDIIASCAGHILESAMPHDYDEKYKSWKIEDLPIFPTTWMLKSPNDAGKRRMLAQIKAGMEVADEITHCGDPDSQGQLLVDEVIDYLGWKGPVKRVLIADLNPGAVQKSLNNVRDNSEFALLSLRALTRSRADWLLGINCSRLFTVDAQSLGIREKMPAGRVQSAVLGLVAKRDLEIKNFKPHNYFSAKLRVQHPNGSFLAKWKPREGQEGLDEEGRLVSNEVLAALQAGLPQSAVIVDADTSRKRQKPLKPFNLSELQKTASNDLGIDMQTTLDIAQKLYEIAKLTTYPRTDCKFLPEDQLAAAPNTLKVVGTNMPEMQEHIDKADPTKKSQAFNDSQVGAHHAIVPTELASPDTVAQLSTNERAIYDLICRRYVAQFYPDAQFDATEIKVGLPDAAGEIFEAKGNVWIDQGWRNVVFGQNAATAGEEDDDDATDEKQTLPKTLTNDVVEGQEIVSDVKKTKPPKHFTDATLIAAMTNIHRYVTNPEVKKMLRENDGIGTEATRAPMVTKLINDHKHLRRDKKTIRATSNGILQYRLMPSELKTPDMAGVFESALKQVESGSMPMDDFLKQMDNFVRSQLAADVRAQWIERAKAIAPQAKASEFKCRNCEEPLYERKTTVKGKNLLFYLCMKDDCGCHFRSDNGAPTSCFKGPLKEKDDAEAKVKLDAMLAAAPRCEECGNPMKRYRKKKKRTEFVWRCHDYMDVESCDSMYFDEDGQPGRMFLKRGELVERVPDGPQCPVCQESPTFKANSKATQQPLLVCKGCDSMMECDAEGVPGRLMKERGGWVEQPLDGPPCPVCKAEKTKKASSKQKKPLWICNGCDSMGNRLKSGKAEAPFKERGKKAKKVAVTQN